MKCETFRTDPLAMAEREEGRAHLRACDECYQVAVAADPVLIFSSMEHEEISPEDTDLLVRDVMSAVGARAHERAIERAEEPPRWTGLMAAAAVILAILSGLFVQEKLFDPANLQTNDSIVASVDDPEPLAEIPAVSKPVVEHYAAPTATIVELPSDDDIQLVMIFDDTLPQDL